MGHSPVQILAMELATPLAFVFPGQGSQSLGMLRECKDNTLIRQTFDEASTVLGYNVWELAEEGPETQLNKTEFTQPVLLTASVALFRLWQSLRAEKPSVMAGHSLGEYSALVCGDAISFEAGLSLVRVRGRLMQQAVKEGQGAMAAIIGLSDDEVLLACQNAMAENPKETVEAANFNSPQQVVISGSKEGVNLAMTHAKKLGAKRVIPLSVSVPSHSSLMKEASKALAEALLTVDITLPNPPIIHNVDAVSHLSVEVIKQALISQLYSPVRWSECVQKIAAKGIKTIVECGPGSVLTGLNKRIVPEVASMSMMEMMERGVVCP